MRTSPRSLLRTGSALGLAAMLALLSVGPGASAPMPAGVAWFDQPLTGSSHPLAPVTITVHATDPTGVVAIHLWIGDEMVESATTDGPSPILSMHEFSWTPAEAGTYLLTVRGEGATGGAGQPASALVTIEAAPAATPTARPTVASTAPPASPVPTATPAPTPLPTPRSTPPPCSPAAPDLLAPTSGIVIRDAGSNPPTFRWGHRAPPTCTPTGYRIQVFDDPDLAHLVADVTLGAVTEWTPPAALPDCATYFWRVATRGTGGTFGPFSAASSFELFIGRCP